MKENERRQSIGEGLEAEQLPASGIRRGSFLLGLGEEEQDGPWGRKGSA